MAYDEHLAERVRTQLRHRDDLEERQMFGGLAFMVGGHMAVTASSRGGLMVRCDPAAAEEHLAAPGVVPFEMGGRTMRGWLHVDAAAVAADEDLRRWVELGVRHVGTLPPA
jgi:TfoX/Sxy family transcriptional regulator of competence genes